MAEYDNDLARLIKLLKADTKFLQSLTKTQVTDLKKFMEENNLAEKDLVEEELTLTEKIAAAAEKTADTIATVADLGQQIRENRDDFKSLQPTVKVAGAVAGELGSKTGKVVSGIGDAVNALSWFGGPWTKAIGTVVGMGLGAIGNFMDKNAKEIAQLGVQFSNFALTELQTAFTAFQTLGKVGALGEEGMSGLYNDALTAGIDITNYSKIVAQSGSGMAYFAGTTEKGAKQLAGLSAATFDTKQKYLALGMSYEEQFELQAKFLERQAQLGSSRVGDVNALAQASNNYLDQLNEISRLSGMSRQAASKALEEQMANTRMNATLQAAKEKDPSGKIADNMSNFVAFYQGKGLKATATGLMDAFGNPNSPAAKKLIAMTNGESQIIVDRMKAGDIDAATGINMLNAAVKKYATEMGGGTKEGAVTWLASVSGKVEAIAGNEYDIIKLMSLPDVTEKSVNEAASEIQKNKEANDETTNQVVDAQESMRKMALGFDKLVKDKVVPNATVAVEKLTDVMDSFIESVTGNKSARKERKAAQQNQGPATGGDSTPDTGEPVDPNGALTGKSLSGVNGALVNALTKAAIEYKAQTGKPVTVTSGVRSVEQQQKLYDDYVSGRSKYPAARPGHSKHDRGEAVDIDSSAANQLDSMGLLAKNGLSRPVKNDPVHIVKAAKGGIFSGAKSGYPAELHGTEAVVPLLNSSFIPMDMSNLLKNGATVPLPNGQSVPVQMQGFKGLLDQLTSLVMPDDKRTGLSGPRTLDNLQQTKQDASIPLPKGKSIPVEMPKQEDPNIAQKIEILTAQNSMIDQMISYAKQTTSSGKKLVAYKSN